MSEQRMAEQRIGEFYRVPAVRVTEWRGFKGWIPVVGPKHEDAEIVGFPWSHFHIDWRFVSQRMWAKYGDYYRQGYHFGYPVQCPDNKGRQVILEGPTLRRLKLKRDPGQYPVAAAKWLPELNEKFACAKLVNGTCPHRGIPVSAMHRDGDILTCPGHGLRWNAITGELVK